jgi:tetratricopeptide (TPR) repeat protein
MSPRVIFTTCWLMLAASNSALAEPAVPKGGMTKEELQRQFVQALDLYKQRKLADAAALYERLLPEMERLFGKDTTTIAFRVGDLATIYYEMGQPAKAEPLYQRVLGIRETISRMEGASGAEHLEVAKILLSLGILYSDTGQYAKAEPLLLRCLTIREEHLAKDHPELAMSAFRLANVYRFTGQAAKAEPLYRRGVEIAEAKFGKDDLMVAFYLSGFGHLYHDMRQYAKAEPLYQRALGIRESKLGAAHLQVASSLSDLGLLYRNMRQFTKAEPLFLRNLQILEASHGKVHPEVATTAFDLADLYYGMNEFAKAESFYQRAIDIREVTLGKDHLAVAYSLHGLAGLHLATGRYADAEPLYERCLKIREAKLGPEHPVVATTLNDLGHLYIEMGRYPRAESLLERSLRIREAKLGNNHLDVAISLSNLGRVQQEIGQYVKAEANYQRSLQIVETLLGKDHPRVAIVLNNLATMYETTGQYAKAELLYLRSLEIREAKLGPNDPVVALSLSNLSGVYARQNQYTKAESLLLRSLQIFETKLGKDHQRVADPLNNLAELYRAMGQYAKAEPLYLRSLKIRETKLGKDHSLTALAVSNLASLYAGMGEFLKAEPLYRRSLQISEARLGMNHPDLAVPLNNLANLYRTLFQYAKAEPLLLRSLQISEAKFGKDHRAVAAALRSLADLYLALGDHAKAEPLYERNLQIRQTNFGTDHPEVSEAHSDLARYWAIRKDWSKALHHVQQARQGAANHLTRVLPGMGEKEQLSFLHNRIEYNLHRHLTIAWAAPKEAGAASAEWMLNGKAIVHQSLAEQHILARDARDPKVRQLLEDLQNTRTRLAALVNRAPALGLEKEYRQEVQQLRTSEQDLAEKLARTVHRPYRGIPWVTLAEFRTKLGPKTAFVDIARFRVSSLETNVLGGWRYLAWITPPPGKGEVLLVDLGDANAIDPLVTQTRQSLIDTAKSVKEVGEVEASDALKKPLLALSEKVLHPLLPTLEKFDEWVVCPDGALWLTPWNALVLPDGKFTVEKYLIRHVVSGRDLVLELPRVRAESAYVFADPDYDLSPGEVMKSAGVQSAGPQEQLDRSLASAINIGVPLFNKKDYEGCCKVYQASLEDARAVLAGRPRLQAAIDQGLAKAAATANAFDRGFVLRDAIDNLRKSLRDVELMREETRFAGSALATMPKVPRLPGTAQEAEAVRPKLQQWLGQEPKLFLEGEASEARLKAVKNPRVLVLATHGYFLPTQEAQTKERPEPNPDEGKPKAALFDKKGHLIENPLLRCGLLLAGCNQRAEAKPGEDDGILTGLEIIGMNLNGCELVVLSACETGLGEVRNGEGVAGLRQAFQLAGAKGVLASLWQVPDRETALLMNAFYSELAGGRSQPEALRQAQLQRIAARQAQFGAAHPFFWAAFALTSRGEDAAKANALAK